VLRSLLPAVLVISTGCSLRHARLDASRDLVITRTGDGLCGPIGIRRGSLGARWGEYVRVSVTSPATVTGEARLHVDGRAYPLQRFTTAPTLDAPMQVANQVTAEAPAVLPLPTQTIVLDVAWTNERLDVPSAIGAGHVIDITLAGLATPQGTCSEVVFTVEQGVFQPNVEERAWVAELIRRGGPELQAWLAAEAQRKETIRQAHYAEADRRKVEWQAQLEARREAVRVEVAARVELEQREAAARVELEHREAAARVEAARVELAARVEAQRVNAERREAIRQAHYAAYERRREGGVAAPVGVAVAVAPAAPLPRRSLVCRAPAASGGAFSGGFSSASVSSVPMVAEESCSEVAATSAEVSQERVAGQGPTGTPAVSDDDEVATEPAGASEQTVVSAARIEASSEWATPAVYAAGRVAVSSEQVVAAAVSPEQVTTERVAVSTEQVAAGAPPCAPASRGTVTVVQPEPVAQVLFSLFGALVNAALQAPTPHAAVAVQTSVHQARPAAPAGAAPAVRPNAPSPTPPAPR